MIINATHLTLNRLAEAIVAHSHAHFSDGLVMRVGLGWEVSNVEAVYSWLSSLYLIDGEEKLAHRLGVLSEADFGRLVENLEEELAQLLRRQSEQLWDGTVYPYPRLLPNMLSLQLSPDLCLLMARALIELLATWQSVDTVIHHCAHVLPGSSGGVRNLAAWLEAQGACFNHHPTELTLPLVSDLIRVLYPDFTPGQ